MDIDNGQMDESRKISILAIDIKVPIFKNKNT